jgi:hypothetical protein
MSDVFEKLNLTDQQQILVLHAPESFLPELARLPVLTIHHHIESVPEIGFLLAFVTRKSQVDALAKAVAARPGRCNRVVCLSQGHIQKVHVRLQPRHRLGRFASHGIRHRARHRH